MSSEDVAFEGPLFELAAGGGCGARMEGEGGGLLLRDAEGGDPDGICPAAASFSSRSTSLKESSHASDTRTASSTLLGFGTTLSL